MENVKHTIVGGHTLDVDPAAHGILLPNTIYSVSTFKICYDDFFVDIDIAYDSRCKGNTYRVIKYSVELNNNGDNEELQKSIDMLMVINDSIETMHSNFVTILLSNVLRNIKKGLKIEYAKDEAEQAADDEEDKPICESVLKEIKDIAEQVVEQLRCPETEEEAKFVTSILQRISKEDMDIIAEVIRNLSKEVLSLTKRNDELSEQMEQISSAAKEEEIDEEMESQLRSM